MFLKPGSIHISTWNQILASSQPYVHDFESYMASTRANCRALISGGCFTFSSSLFTSPTSLQPYLPCLWARQFGFQQFIPTLPPLPYVQLDFELVQKLVKDYQTPSCSIRFTSLSMTQPFSSWWNIIFDELLSSCSPTTSKTVIGCICIHKFISCLSDFPFSL